MLPLVNVRNLVLLSAKNSGVYTVVDIETTGNGIHGNRITEIALFNIDDGQITDSFSSLVNPGCEIPPFITGLTGITTAMVRNAPDFKSLAPTIMEFTQDRVFIAHSVNFDYPIVKKEFERCGEVFIRKKLCTVRLSRRIFPGYKSYSLGKLCSSLNIPLTDRHRAAGDARATALLFQKMLSQAEGPALVQHFLNARSQETTLPPNLPKESYLNIPATAGIYYFRDKNGEIIYVGKAINLKKRVLGHFYDRAEREQLMCRETHSIDYEQSGSELMALLMESIAIKTYFPKYNRAQKKQRPLYGLFDYADRDGVRHLAVNRLQKGQQSPKVFYNQTEARLFLEALSIRFGLCAKYCHLQEGARVCNHFRVPQCAGVCRGTESPSDYNQKVEAALEDLREENKEFLIREKGRNRDEEAIIWVRNNRYRGYAFIPRTDTLANLVDLEARIQWQTHSSETDRIIQSYLLRNSLEIIELETSDSKESNLN